MPQYKVVNHEKDRPNSDLNKLINLQLHVACFYHHLAHHFARSRIAVFESFFRQCNKSELDRAVLLINVLQRHGGQLVRDRQSSPREKTFTTCVNTIRAVFQLETAIYQLVAALHCTAAKLNDVAFDQFLTEQYSKERLEAVRTLTDYHQVLQPNVGGRLKWPLHSHLGNRRVSWTEPHHSHHHHHKQANNLLGHEFIYDQNDLWIDAK